MHTMNRIREEELLMEKQSKGKGERGEMAKSRVRRGARWTQSGPIRERTGRERERVKRGTCA